MAASTQGRSFLTRCKCVAAISVSAVSPQARQLITMQLLVTLAVAAAALVHPGPLARRCSPVRHRCVPVASDRISDNNRAARTQKQQERQTDADRASRSVLEQQQLALKAHRAAIEEFEGSSDWRATLNELHRLRKQ